VAISRRPFAVLVALAAFGAGFACAHLLERNARAESAPSSTVYVPADGLAFRTLDGRVIARLAYDHKGGFFDVYDNDERPTATLRADAIADQAVTRPPNPLDMHIK
jgi:hypothetical protein